MNKIPDAVIGCGYLGRFHTQKYAGHPEAALMAVVDTSSERAKALAAETGTRALSDYRDLYTQVQAASVVVPTPSHYAIARDLLEHGINLLLEKPMTTTLAEAQELNGLARERNLVLQIGHLERFIPAYLAVADTVKNPLFIESHRLNSFQERGTEVNVMMPWGQLGEGMAVTLSVGLCESADFNDSSELVRRADEALYGAKDAGRDRNHVWSSDRA